MFRYAIVIQLSAKLPSFCSSKPIDILWPFEMLIVWLNVVNFDAPGLLFVFIRLIVFFFDVLLVKLDVTPV